MCKKIAVMAEPLSQSAAIVWGGETCDNIFPVARVFLWIQKRRFESGKGLQRDIAGVGECVPFVCGDKWGVKTSRIQEQISQRLFLWRLKGLTALPWNHHMLLFPLGRGGEGTERSSGCHLSECRNVRLSEGLAAGSSPAGLFAGPQRPCLEASDGSGPHQRKFTWRMAQRTHGKMLEVNFIPLACVTGAVRPMYDTAQRFPQNHRQPTERASHLLPTPSEHRYR